MNYFLWRQLSEMQCLALHESKLLKKFTDEQIFRLQTIQKRTLVNADRYIKAASSVLGRAITKDEAGLEAERLLSEYMAANPEKKLPTLEEDLLALIPVSKWYLVGAKPGDENNADLKKA